MHQAGTRSWRFSHDIGETPHALLYVRDALRLPVGVTAGVPPPLIDEVPDRSSLVYEVDLAIAAAEWVAWWTAAGEIQPQVQRLSGEEAAGILPNYRRITDPETSPTLGDSWRAAAKALYVEGCHWLNDGPRLHGVEQALAGLEWRFIRDAVEGVASEARVSAGAINAAVSLLFVQGNWGAVTAPGFAWCSVAAADNPPVCSEIIRAAMKSGLT